MSVVVAGLAVTQTAPEVVTKPRRIAFAGTPDEAVPALTALVEAGFKVPLVVTAPPARRSRRAKSTPTPVGMAAEKLGLKVSHSITDVADGAVAVDCVVVVAFGQLISADLLARIPMLNLHFSLLPRWRGAAPVERALLAGDTDLGVCLMRIEPALDTGPLYWCEQIAAGNVCTGDSSTAAELRAELAGIGARRLVRSLQEGLGEPTPQQGEPTYAKKLTREDRQLRWELPAEQLARVVRIGGAWTTLEGSVLKVHEVRIGPQLQSASPQGAKLAGASPVSVSMNVPVNVPPRDAAVGTLWGDAVRCGIGGTEEGEQMDTLVLVTVQQAGRGSMPASEWLRGARLAPGVMLGG